LELAVDGLVDVIFTGDRVLLALDPFRGIPAISPADFLRR
jgi:predicted nucleic acid-binding protein